MAHRSNTFRRSALTWAACTALPLAAMAQDPATVTVTGRTLGSAGVAGFGDAPLASSPLQASLFGNQQLRDAGIGSLGGLTRLDASLGDAYNAEGYWSILSARGYTLDNRSNYRRDGLPINAETAIALDNKERLELLKGTSGIQAGTSSPGGLVDLVVKRPTGKLREARIEWREPGSVLGAVDLGQRFGADGQFALRLNAAYERLRPQVHDADGQRQLFALAADWQPGPDTLLQAEFESSRQTQPSVAGFSMLGDTVPSADAVDPLINLNRQPWGQPVVMDGDTASLRWRQRLTDDWRFSAHAMTQRLKSDDRTAFPYGVYDASYDCPQWCDRYAPDGSFSYWQYVSDNERRTSDALELAFSGQAVTAGIGHQLQAGVLLTRFEGRFQDQVFDLATDLSGVGVGLGHIDGTRETLPSAGTTDANTNRDERSTEWFLRDAMRLGAHWQLWAGLRHTQLQRESARTSPADDGPGEDGLRATRYDQSATLPWLALAHELSPGTLLYASWGEGLETDVAPNRARYVNRGQPLPALKSRQFELGLKWSGKDHDATLAWFDIDRPQAADIGPCDAADSCKRQIDGSARHRGAEAQAALRAGAWAWRASAMWLDAERQGSTQPGVNGTRPVNVPSASLRLGTEYSVGAMPGLALQGSLVAESDRVVLPYDDSVRIPGWARLDLGVRWEQAWAGTALLWRVGVDNVTDQRAWKESPYQFGHAYLYPLAPRAWRASLQASF
ncbi:MAG: TonB-dependent siderophore receptor [Betaproteobacteria bacterium]|nr:TonB-dependent siderophore receptor [Betaproteobacteria bacterium]